jgi:hypothetical protein
MLDSNEDSVTLASEAPITLQASESIEQNLPDTPVTRLLTQPAPVEGETAPQFKQAITLARKRPGTRLLLAGVVLPIISFAIETTTRICAEEFFDPMPTLWHHLLVIMVPLANLWVWRETRKDEAVAATTWLLELLNGVALGVAIYYTILYAPLLPLSLLALLFFGLGLLSLTPILALIAGALLTRHLRRLRQAQHVLKRPLEQRIPALAFGVVLAFGLLIAAELPSTLARVHLQEAASTDSAMRLKGVRWLRAYGQEKTILNACYGRIEEKANLVGFLFNAVAPVSHLQAREIYYRVTGKPFDSVPSPRRRNWDWDGPMLQRDATGEMLGQVSAGLSLGSSRLDGSVDAEAALGYLEWTLVFKNTAGWQQEARAHLALPPGGVVSRLTLWVNGEEREAAFAARGKVEAAYQAVVRTRRDPVLVTSSGPDRVQVQCFPVPPNGEMKVRLGITAPLTVAEREQGWLQLPRVLERNFAVSDNFAHSVWIEAKQPVTTTSQHLKSEHPDARLFAVRGQLPHADLVQHTPAGRIQCNPTITQAWVADPYDQTAVITQQAIEQEVVAPARVVVVVDSSQAMQWYAGTVADALTALPEGVEFTVLLAGDDVRELTPLQRANKESAQQAGAAVRQAVYQGGTDNLAALTQAWNLAAQQPSSAVVWIHAPQPVLLGDALQLRQGWERRPRNPLLYELQIQNGPNLIAEALDGISAVQPVARLGDTRTDLTRLFERWRSGARQLVFTRQKVKANDLVTHGDNKQASKHLARLWAFEEVTRLLANSGTQARQTASTDAYDAAVKLAAAYQLVTPVTGAVVLETQEQYQRAGLQPVERSTVPTIPEPEVWALLVVALLLLGWTVCQHLRMWQGGRPC